MHISEAKRRRSSCNHRGSRPARWALLPSTNRVTREKQSEHRKISQPPHYWQTPSQLYTAKPCIPTFYHAPLLLAPWWSTFTHVYYIYIYEYINLKKQYTYVHVCRCGQCLTGWVSCAWLHDDAATYICIYLYIYLYTYIAYIYMYEWLYIYIKQYTHRRTCVYTLSIYILNYVYTCICIHMYI